MRYFIEFEAKPKNSIGSTSNYSRSIDAETFEAARMELYNDFDHILIKSVNGEKFDFFNQPK